MKKINLNLLLRFIVLISFSVILYNCSNDREAIYENTEQNAVYANENPAIREERSNPLEYIGVEHNMFMAEFTAKLEQSFIDGRWDQIAFLSKEYKTQFSTVMNDAYHVRYTESTSTVAYQEGIYDQVDLSEWFDGDPTTAMTLASNVLNTRATIKDRDFTMNLLIEIFNAAQQATTNDEAYIALEDVVSRHERLILAETWQDDERYALGALAVAKHSTQY